MEHQHAIAVVDIELQFLQHAPGAYTEAIVVPAHRHLGVKSVGHFEVIGADVYPYLCGAAAKSVSSGLSTVYHVFTEGEAMGMICVSIVEVLHGRPLVR